MQSKEAGRFISFPTNRVVGTLANAEDARAAVEALLAAGFADADIDVLHGEGDAQRLDPTGTEHGFLARFQQALLHTATPVTEFSHLKRHIEDLRAGRYIVMVLARQRDQRIVAADMLNAHGAEFVGFYGRWAWQGLPFTGTVPIPVRPGQQEQTAPTEPEHFPALFAEAWNARDPDRIAALFELDAEFVNVTGLWWHDRPSIRKAHDYGLARILNEATLTVRQVAVKRLSEDVAVVHARMSISGQTPMAGIAPAGDRTTIFSFVLRRSGEFWPCASAQNTDVVPEMEANIIDEGRELRPADYRSGRPS